MNATWLLQFVMHANLLIFACLSAYLFFKIRRHANARLLLAAILSPFAFQLGASLFTRWPSSLQSAGLIVLGLGMIPLAMTPLSHNLGRSYHSRARAVWAAYYLLQILLLAFLVKQLLAGQIVEWVTGILDQPVILITQSYRLLFFNVLVSCGIALVCFQNTLKNAGGDQLESLKFVFIAFLGLLVYFAYVAAQIVFYSYIPQSILLSGAVIIFLALLLLGYTLAKYPFWEVKIHVSRRAVFGSLTVTAMLIYLVISGSIIDLLRVIQPDEYHVLFPATVFALVAVLLLFYLSPRGRARLASFVTRHFFRNKYDYRELWMKFSEKSSGSATIADLLPKVSEFIASAMFVKQVAIWLRSPASESFALAYSYDSGASRSAEPVSLSLRVTPSVSGADQVYSTAGGEREPSTGPIADSRVLQKLGIRRFALVHGNDEILAILGVGEDVGGKEATPEDDQLLLSISNQVAHLILNQKLSDEIVLAKEWESFNRLASFIIHDLKNLATLQSMTLENARTLGNHPAFLADAFATFNQTTEKMINLIASLSVQRGQFSFKQQPVNVIEIIANTCEDLKIEQRNGLKLVTTFPPTPPMVAGDRDLLRKAFTNLLLNAIQSLPRGEGAVEVSVTPPANGKITAAIKDTGCGIPPEQLKNLFRPFQTTKAHGMGIGLCHTRSIVEVHGGRIRVESEVNAGTKVEVELPTL